MQHEPRRVVVTGMGAVTPIGLTVATYWDALLKGMSGAAPITYFDATDFETTFACELKGFDVRNYLDRKLARHLDPFCHYALVAADEALMDAGLRDTPLTPSERERIGVTFGSSIGGIQTIQQQTAIYLSKGVRRMSPFTVPMMLPNMASGHIAMRYDLRGPASCAVSACATGNDNLGAGYQLIQAGDVDIMLCGGSEADICEIAVGGFNAMHALSTRNASPSTASRPFDATRDGFVMGEGAGAIVLEALDHAKARGAHIYAEMVGFGSAADAHHMTTPLAAGQQRAMERLLSVAHIQAVEVDYINMHGTSTVLGDATETAGIKAVFGEHAHALQVSSTKSMTGHLQGAAGAVEAIATILSLVHQVVPPTINFTEPDPACDLNYTFHTPLARPIHIALSNAFGFGGHSTCIGFRAWTYD